LWNVICLSHLNSLGHCATGFTVSIRYMSGNGQSSGSSKRAIQAWMGHKNIQHTARYTKYSSNCLKRHSARHAGRTQAGESFGIAGAAAAA
jgi:hypothetical protein